MDRKRYCLPCKVKVRVVLHHRRIDRVLALLDVVFDLSARESNLSANPDVIDVFLLHEAPNGHR